MSPDDILSALFPDGNVIQAEVPTRLAKLARTKDGRKKLQVALSPSVSIPFSDRNEATAAFTKATEEMNKQHPPLRIQDVEVAGDDRPVRRADLSAVWARIANLESSGERSQLAVEAQAQRIRSLEKLVVRLMHVSERSALATLRSELSAASSQDLALLTDTFFGLSDAGAADPISGPIVALLVDLDELSPSADASELHGTIASIAERLAPPLNELLPVIARTPKMRSALACLFVARWSSNQRIVRRSEW